MGVQAQAVRYGQRRVLRRLTRALPWIGTAVALVTVGSAIRRKGVLRGSLDTALNAIPFVGGVKNVAETLRGRDFFGDKAAGDPRQDHARPIVRDPVTAPASAARR